MKTLSLLLCSVLLLSLSTSQLHSQAAPGKTAAAMLLDLKKNNDTILAQQAATLKALEAMELEAQQMRILIKRS